TAYAVSLPYSTLVRSDRPGRSRVGEQDAEDAVEIGQGAVDVELDQLDPQRHRPRLEHGPGRSERVGVDQEAVALLVHPVRQQHRSEEHTSELQSRENL